MSNPFVGEIRLFAGNFAPNGWAFCDGQLLAIADNEVLFQLIGTTYGGDGQNTYALPDLRGRVPVHQGQGSGLSPRVIGAEYGVETVALTLAQTPAHTHVMQASTNAATPGTGPANVLGASASPHIWGSGGTAGYFGLNAVTFLQGGQPHENMGPSLGLNFIISLFGIFPSQN